jgi:hypothetical protein
VFYGKAEEDNLEMDWTPKAYVYKSIWRNSIFFWRCKLEILRFDCFPNMCNDLPLNNLQAKPKRQLFWNLKFYRFRGQSSFVYLKDNELFKMTLFTNVCNCQTYFCLHLKYKQIKCIDNLHLRTTDSNVYYLTTWPKYYRYFNTRWSAGCLTNNCTF